MALAADGDLTFLHRLEKSRLHLRRRTVDLIGKDQIGEDRPLLKLELALAAFAEIDFGSGDVGRQQVGGELNARQAGFEVLGQALDRPGFGKPWQTLDKKVTVPEQTKQETLDHRLLTDDRLADSFAECLDVFPVSHSASLCPSHMHVRIRAIRRGARRRARLGYIKKKFRAKVIRTPSTFNLRSPCSGSGTSRRRDAREAHRHRHRASGVPIQGGSRGLSEGRRQAGCRLFQAPVPGRCR